jgi:exosortase/archaeosortase family protein
MVQLAQSQDGLRDFTKPVVIATLQAVGIDAHDQGETMQIGHLNVPWTRDCAGINLVIILLALALWVNGSAPFNLRLALRIALMIPAALVANIARVFSLIAWRAAIFPAVESPQTHYFLGLIWLVPFVTLIAPKGERPAFHTIIETLHAAAVVALLAPMSGTPNGTLITLCAVISLTHIRLQQDHARLRTWLSVLWIIGGAGIALVSMDSFWLPWMLVCPLLVEKAWVGSIAGLVVIACTHSVLAMQPWAPWIGGVALAVSLISSHSKIVRDSITNASVQLNHSGLRWACVACFALPFMASSLLAFQLESWSPPPMAESLRISSEGFQLRVPGQPDDIALVCYTSPTRDRHHTVEVCLKFRGTDVTPVADNSPVFTDGENWMREFFLQDHALHQDYSSYVRSTFRPWASPGVHLICVVPKGKLTHAEFDQQSLKIATTLHRLCESRSNPSLAQRP